jgi:signal transduction histidine kinase
MTEMRRLLGVLRQESDAGQPSPAFAPQPSMQHVDELVEQVREAGLPVTVEVSGEPADLPPGVDLSGYRIVQEALTNALRHAGPATATLRVEFRDDELALEILDDGRGAATASEGRGHGLVGMKERVELFGGELRVGPRPGGGFAVLARLPYGKRRPS